MEAIGKESEIPKFLHSSIDFQLFFFAPLINIFFIICLLVHQTSTLCIQAITSLPLLHLSFQYGRHSSVCKEEYSRFALKSCSNTNFSSVVRKLMLFTAAMVFLPLTTFFTCQYLFDNSIVSGGSAAVAANAVLIAYIVVAFTEDTSEASEEKESKKDI